MWDRLKPGDAFFLTDMELALLLEAKGISSFQGFPLEHYPKKEEDVLQTIFSMTEKGLLHAREEEFQTAGELSACMEILKNAKGILAVIPEEKDIPQICCYPGENLLTIEASALRSSTFKLQRISWEELEEKLKESGPRMELEFCRKGGEGPIWQAILRNREDGLVREWGEGEEAFSIEILRKEIWQTEEVLLL